MRSFSLSYRALFLLIMGITMPPLPLEAAGNDEPLFPAAVCEAYPRGKSSPEMKMLLLASIKDSLLLSAHAAEKRLDDSIDCFRSRRHDKLCEAFRSKLISVLGQRLNSVKIFSAIAEQNSFRLMQLSRNANLNLAMNQELPPSLVANFEKTGFRYTEEEKTRALRAWRRMTIKTMALEIELKNLEPDSRTCQDFMLSSAPEIRRGVVISAKQSVNSSLEQNPLLEILRGRPLDEQNLEEALVEMRNYNDKFVQLVRDMRVDHADTVASRFILTAHDHEMALVNFPKFAASTIRRLPESQRAEACASWAGLEKQQSQRVNSSIGVGFGTSVVCGAGIISGLGTLPALVGCLPSIADGLWGGYRGYVDAKTARLSAFSGREMNQFGEMSPGIRTKEEARALERQGNLVALINFAGIAPVLSGAMSATSGAKGTLKSFAKIPISDSSVSAVEMNADKIASILKAAKEEDKASPVAQSPSFSRVAAFRDKCEKILYAPAPKATRAAPAETAESGGGASAL